jgi:two-component sensor histidine kinase
MAFEQPVLERWKDTAPATPRESLDSRLSEAHHRIANNLAMLVGFVRLHTSAVASDSRSLEASEAVAILEEIGVRIETVGRLHRLLSATPAGSHVDLADYLNSTCQAIEESFDLPTRVICRATPAPCDSEAAGLIGLIVTELVTNAMKYAHPAGAPGRVEVACSPGRDGGLVIGVTDDGVGLPPDFDPATGGGLGFRVVRSMARQLRAETRFESGPLGLEVSLAIPPRTVNLAI